METKFMELAKKRRSIYALGRDVKLSQDDLVTLIKNNVKQGPSAFNNQTTRVAILFGDSHEELWDIVINRLKQEVPNADAFKRTAAKVNRFKAAYGTILFFTETKTVAKFEHDFPLYAANFQDWSEQSQGNAQYAVWTSLAENGVGANLQHYNPLIDDDVHSTFNIPASWRLRAEMDFGSIEAPAADKDYLADDERFLIFK